VSPENPQNYVAGALLSNGAELTEIHTDYVVLERGGKRSRLRIEGVLSRNRADVDQAAARW
jgi:hypothetical protein